MIITTLPEKYPGKNVLGKLLCEIRSLLKKQTTVRNGQATEAVQFQDEFAHDRRKPHSTSSTTPTLISETEVPVLILDKHLLIKALKQHYRQLN